VSIMTPTNWTLEGKKWTLGGRGEGGSKTTKRNQTSFTDVP
jgi:hypothetical protein